MRIRLYNAFILTMKNDEDDTPFMGEIWVQGDKITYIGEVVSTNESLFHKEKTKEIEKFDREIDCEKNLLLPGFKNAHTHSAMTFLRSYADDLPLQEWLFDKVFPMEAKLTADDNESVSDSIYTLAKLAMLEYLTSGITANFDMYLDNTAHARASIDMGFRTVLCGGINDFGGTVDEMEEEYLRLNEMHPLVSAQIGFHAEYTTKKEILNDLAKLGQKHKAPIYTHLAETENEVEGCIGRYQMTPTKFLDSIGIFEYGGGGFHGVYLNDEDREICKKKGVSIVSNPSSNLKLASGIADVCAMEDAGINVAIGTDGSASNNALDFFREMYLVSVLQKVTKKDAAVMDANRVLRMATVGGAKAMGLDDCDTLEVGKCADIVCIDLARPNMQPMNNMTKNLIYSGSKENVKMTMIAGKVLYEKGLFFVGEEAGDIYRKANEIIGRMR